MRFKTILLAVVGVLAAAVILIQLLPVGGSRANPAVAAEPAWSSAETRTLFMRTCGDCHSNETDWPWYSRIAPISWSIADHVYEGREVFNVSEWGRPGENEGEEAAEALIHGEMPLRQYLLLHPEARLSEVERDLLVRGLTDTFGSELRGGDGDGED